MMADKHGDPKNNQSIKLRSHSEWFLFYLFNDPDFIQEKMSINESIIKFIGIEGFGVMILLATNESMCVQLLNTFDHSLAKPIIESIESLAHSFSVSVATIELGLRYSNTFSDYILGTTPSAGIEDGKIVIRFDALTRLDDIKDMYWYIEELQSQLIGYHPRNRVKEKTILVYALHKQRLSGKTWKEVYQLYELGQLPLYQGAKSISNEENLAKMYKRYMSDI